MDLIDGNRETSMNEKQRIFTFYFTNIILPLFIGMMVYLCSPQSTYFSDFVESVLHLSFPKLLPSAFFSFTRNYLCDAFWAYSLSFSLNIFIKNTILIFSACMIWCVIFELLQKYNRISGTFDYMDILFELIAVITALSIIYFHNKEQKS